MASKRSINLSLLALVLAGFIYRFALMNLNGFPPGADIGLHQSVINSILAPKTTFLYNYYHMGGGISLTNPGYHIFAAFIMSMTGASEYLIQVIVATMFSTLISLCTFLFVRLILGELTAFIAAILMVFSASDILMLCWGGYPNIVSLSLIPLLFYFLLQPTKLSQTNYIVITSLITSALMLTHLFSGFLFLTIVAFASIVSIILKKSTGFTKNHIINWVIPIFFGFILASPYIFSVLPTYFGSQGAITGTVSVMKQAVVETRIVPSTILTLAVIPLFMFLIFSKKQKGKYFTLSSILLASATLVPLVAAQGYVFGLFLDYERFLYFLALPVIICIGLVIIEVSNVISKALEKVSIKVSPGKAKPIVVTAIIIVCLLTPLFSLPNIGLQEVNFYQVMDSSKYEAVKWIKANTPPESVIVSDAEFGWWISGFSQRRTLSAVDPQYLILEREFAPAQVARNLLETDYSIDNGLLKIQQVGSNASWSTHEIYAIMNYSVFTPLVFSINDLKISLLYRDNGVPKEIRLGEFMNSNTQVLEDHKAASFIVTRENENYRLIEEITITKGAQFARITFFLQNTNLTNFDWIRIPFQSRGQVEQYANSIGIVDNTLHVVNQLVFPNNQLGKDVLLEENTNNYELVFKLDGNYSAQTSFFVGLYHFEPNTDVGTNQSSYYQGLIENNSRTYLNAITDKPITCFDYRTALSKWSINYIAIRDTEIIDRFLSDSTFKVAFQNSEVTVFRVLI